MKLTKQFTILFVFLIILFGCQVNEKENFEQPIFYTSIYPLEFVVEQLTNDFAITETVFPPGVDAHTYEPTIKEILAIADGAAFYYLGQGMEGSADKISEALKNSDVKLIEIGAYESLFLKTHELDEDDYHGHSHDDFDPHFWFDPERMIHLSEIIKDELIKSFPQHERTITENHATLTKQLVELDEQFANRLSGKSNPHIIVSHAAYGYWENKYDIKQIPISGLLASDEPSQKALAHLVELAQAHALEYVLFEQSTSNRLATIVQEEIGAEALSIHNLETLLPEDLAANEDYFSLMRRNLDILDQVTH